MKGLSTNTTIFTLIDGKYIYEVIEGVGNTRVAFLYVNEIKVASVTNTYFNIINVEYAIPLEVLNRLLHLSK